MLPVVLSLRIYTVSMVFWHLEYWDHLILHYSFSGDAFWWIRARSYIWMVGQGYNDSESTPSVGFINWFRVNGGLHPDQSEVIFVSLQTLVQKCIWHIWSHCIFISKFNVFDMCSLPSATCYQILTSAGGTALFLIF